MTKNDFKNIVLGMQEPVLYEIPHPYWDLLSCVIYIEDAKNVKNKHELQCLKLTCSEYRQHMVENYYEREKKAKLKYERWLHEFCGNYGTSKLSIV